MSGRHYPTNVNDSIEMLLMTVLDGTPKGHRAYLEFLSTLADIRNIAVIER